MIKLKRNHAHLIHTYVHHMVGDDNSENNKPRLQNLQKKQTPSVTKSLPINKCPKVGANLERYLVNPKEDLEAIPILWRNPN